MKRDVEQRGRQGRESEDGGKSDRRLAPGEEVKFRGLGLEKGCRRGGAQ